MPRMHKNPNPKTPEVKRRENRARKVEVAENHWKLSIDIEHTYVHTVETYRIYCPNIPVHSTKRQQHN